MDKFDWVWPPAMVFGAVMIIVSIILMGTSCSTSPSKPEESQATVVIHKFVKEDCNDRED